MNRTDQVSAVYFCEKAMQKTALVTGGSRGIGAATAKTLTSRGWRVAFVYKSGSGTAHELQQECGALPLQGDVSNEADVQRIFSEASSHLGTPITHLVNNAGTEGRSSQKEQLSFVTHWR